MFNLSFNKLLNLRFHQAGESPITNRRIMSQLPFEPGPECLPRGDSRPDAVAQERRGADSVAGSERAAFLSAMRHELHLPMNIFAGMGWLLQHSGLNPTQQHYLHELQTAGAHLLRIVERLLDDGATDPDPDRESRPTLLSPIDVGAATTSALLPGQQAPAAPPWDEVRWRDLLARLSVLLDDADTACLQLAREHEGWLRVRFGLAYEAWARALRDFDFELALRLLQAVGYGSASA